MSRRERHLLEGRVQHVRDLCLGALDRDGAYTDRAWLAQSVLNILNGNVDAQIYDEQHR
jgi:hypothetical protein